MLPGHQRELGDGVSESGVRERQKSERKKFRLNIKKRKKKWNQQAVRKKKVAADL